MQRVTTMATANWRFAAVTLSVSLMLAVPDARAQIQVAVDCSNAQTTAEMVSCLGGDYEAADARLNTVYQQQRAGLDEQGQALLRDAQRAWIVFRDAECERARDVVRGGTLAAVIGSACMVDLTRERAAQLENESAESALLDSTEAIFWRAGEPLVDRFLCEGPVEARVGLVPGFNPEKGPTLSVRLRIGTESLDFPIDSAAQEGLCGPDVSLGIYDAGECPGIRLDDGMCDAFLVSWSAKQNSFTWTRR